MNLRGRFTPKGPFSDLNQSEDDIENIVAISQLVQAKPKQSKSHEAADVVQLLVMQFEQVNNKYFYVGSG